MNDTYDSWEQAKGRLGIAMERMLDKYPFHVAVLERFQLAARPDVGTMGVAPAGDNIQLAANPDFVLSTPVDELVGVLLHEVHHVVFGHVTADPQEYSDEWARTVAEEVTVNEFIAEPLPEGAIQLSDFPRLPPMESTDERYDRLKKTTSRKPISGPRKVEPSDGSSGAATPPGKSKSAAPKPTPRTVDDHSVWQESTENRSESAEAIQKIIDEAVCEVGADEVPEDLRSAIDASVAGNAPGADEYELQNDKRGQLDWRQLLRRYVGQIVQVRPVYSRPSRRFPDLVGIIPGRRRQSGRPKIMAVIDTSASMTPALLEMIDGELARLARNFVVQVVECDTRIHAVYKYKPLKAVSGRGGTDLRPPLAKKFLREHGPDMVIFFTDGFGPAPEKAPGIPVVWCITPGGMAPATWGRVVQMPGENTPTV